MRNLLLLLLLTVSTSLSDLSAQWNAFVNNYKKDLFGRGSKTWDIHAYDENHIYYANQNGVVEYNGYGWKLYPIENQNDVRSIYISQKRNRIYVGGY